MMYLDMYGELAYENHKRMKQKSSKNIFDECQKMERKEREETRNEHEFIRN